jgi:DNA polymerase I
MPPKRLLLVDGNGVLYRSYFAIKSLTTKDGRPTNAVFGFVRVLRQLVQVWQPTHWAVTFDGGIPVERLLRLATYKAQRPPMPDALRAQFPAAEEYLERARVTAIRMDRQEADDVLASLSRRAADDGAEVLIATADKDLFQLVSERVHLIAPSQAAARIGPEEVREKTGVDPGRIVEWLALTGDSVDNIPGVAGMGPKTAAKTLNAFGSLDGIWDRIKDVEPVRIREALVATRDRVESNREVIRLRTDLDCWPGWERMEARPEDPVRLVPFFEKMEFRTLARTAQEPSLF